MRPLFCFRRVTSKKELIQLQTSKRHISIFTKDFEQISLHDFSNPLSKRSLLASYSSFFNIDFELEVILTHRCNVAFTKLNKVFILERYSSMSNCHP